MSGKVKLYIVVLIWNIIDIVSFTILAIIFEHWWIVFFAGLFTHSFSDIKEEEKDDETDNETYKMDESHENQTVGKETQHETTK